MPLDQALNELAEKLKDKWSVHHHDDALVISLKMEPVKDWSWEDVAIYHMLTAVFLKGNFNVRIRTVMGRPWPHLFITTKK